MTANYVLIERITIGAAVSSITLSNIPQTGYTDLKIQGSFLNTYASSCRLTFNGSASGYTEALFYGSGSTAAAASNGGGGAYIAWGYNQSGSTTIPASNNIYIPNYKSANNKVMTFESTAPTTSNGQVYMGGATWANSAAITSIKFDQSVGGGTFLPGSTISLYGIAAVGVTPVIAPYATGGDVIQTDGTYWYHAFISSGSFVPAKALSCDVLVVAGGGGGGANNSVGGGGGGAGGLVGFTSQAIAATSQTVTIGAGGVGATYNTVSSTNGTNSQLGSLTAAVGGGRGQSVGSTGGWESGGNGGSGGGGGIAAVGTGTAGQGNNGGGVYNGGGGGAGAVGSNGVGGGGSGGAGGAGATYNTTVGGSAGPYAFINAMGTATNLGQLSSSNYYFAGGGGGYPSAGGLGGGGSANGGSGTPNTGGGGSAISSTSAAGTGGSGVVIIRYAI